MILLTGSTGFLGSYIVETLRLAQHEVRALTTGGGDWRSNALSGLKQMGVEAVVGNLLNPRVVAAALDGCDAVINAAGGLAAGRDMSAQDIHVEAVRILCEQAIDKGVQRFIQISCLGANEHSDSEYLRCKWQGEQIVKRQEFFWTILRPSYMFGAECELINCVMPFMRVPFVIPVIGSGLNRLQPICVEDVASCVEQSIFKQETVHQTIDLTGPKTYTFTEFIELLRQELHLVKPTVPVPLNTALKYVKPVERMYSRLPLNIELFQLLMSDSQSRSTLMKVFFQVSGATLEEYISSILNSYNQ